MTKVIKIFAIFILLTAFAAIAAAYWMFSSLTAQISHDKADEYVVIERGTTPDQVIAKLNEEGIIKPNLAVRIYLRTIGDTSKLQAGEHKFPSPISPIEALKEMEKGTVKVDRLTIPEGFTRFDIAKRIASNFTFERPYTEDEILKLMDNTSLIKDIAPNAKNLEGYIYPSTYDFAPNTPPDKMIERMVNQFKKIWKPEWNDQAKKLGRTPHEIITIASLIETESPVESERPIVSSVIYNRINKNMALGIDQTVVYVAKMQNRWDGTIHKSDIEADSPYNTRKYRGIPPGPISSVTQSSIEAALNPATTNYIFYVLRVNPRDGSHHFYASAAEFERGKAEYQKWLAEQRRLKRENETGN